MIFEPLLLGLAAWRLAYLLIEEDGPFRLFARIRHIVGADEPGELNGLAFAFTCMYCMSVWTSILLWLLFVREGPSIYLIFTYSAIAVGFHESLRYVKSRGS